MSFDYEDHLELIVSVDVACSYTYTCLHIDTYTDTRTNTYTDFNKIAHTHNITSVPFILVLETAVGLLNLSKPAQDPGQFPPGHLHAGGLWLVVLPTQEWEREGERGRELHDDANGQSEGVGVQNHSKPVLCLRVFSATLRLEVIHTPEPFCGR